MPRGAQLIDRLQRTKLPVDLAYGAILARARHSAGFSQPQMAEQINATKTAVAWMETGRAALSAYREHAYETVLIRRRVLRARGTLQKAFHSLEEILADQGIDLVLPESKRGAATDRKATPPELRQALNEAATQAWARHRTGKDKEPFKGRWPKASKE